MQMKLAVLLLGCLVALVAAQPPVAGTATVVIDFTGFSSDVTVSVCSGSNTYNSQGGAVRTYTLATVNAPVDCQFVIQESAARLALNVSVSNGVNVNISNRVRSSLTVHLEGFNPAAVGNTFSVRLRADVNGQPNIFREYADVGLPALATRLPTSALGALPQTVGVVVPVLRTEQPVTVWVGENRGTVVPAAWVVCHTALLFSTDANCADGVCDSGRCIARLQAPFDCTAPQGPVDFPFQTVGAQLTWTPSASVVPPTVVREWPALVPGVYNWYVLASDNFQVSARYPGLVAPTIVKTVASTCSSGSCEATPITSVLTVDVCTLNTTVVVSVDGAVFGTYTGVRGGRNRICVLNLPRTQVRATFPSSAVVSVDNIDCATVSQTCAARVCNILTPNWGCMGVGSMVDPTFQWGIDVLTANGTNVYSFWGRPPASIAVPALADLTLRVSEGRCPWRPATLPLDARVTGCTFANYAISSCAAGACTTERVGRVLSLFDLAYLPLRTNVFLQNTDGSTFRFVDNQGDDPRCYCVPAVELKGRLVECESEWTSEVTSCVAAQTGVDDCSLCDFLSILTVDLSLLPRETRATISTGRQYGTERVLVNENFGRYSPVAALPPAPGAVRECCQNVNGNLLTPAWYNKNTSETNIIRVCNNDCNGSPAAAPGATSRVALRVGRMDNGVMQNASCTRFSVPDGMTALTVSFQAWQQGNGNNSQQAFVRSHGQVSGVDALVYINVAPNTWTFNEFQLLLVQPLETVEVCFYASMTVGTLVDDVRVVGQAFPVTACRDEFLIGNRVNNFVVLRSGAGTGVPQRYCVEVFDGDARKTQCTVCDGKTCQAEEPWVCTLCLDLSSPNNIPGIENRLTVDINYGPSGGDVRVIPGQGGTNGCAGGKRTTEEEEALRRYRHDEEELERQLGLTPSSVRHMSRAQVRATLAEVEERMEAKRAQYVNLPDRQSRFSVLCLKYDVCVSERTLGPKCFPVDCTPYGTCSYRDIVSLATINLVCNGNPPAAGMLPQQGVDVTIFDAAARWDAQTGLLVAGDQVRGPRSPVVIDNVTCAMTAERWVGPSFTNVGNTLLQFPVLCLRFQVKLEEHPLIYDRSTYPDPLQHPYSTGWLDCTGRRFCNISQTELLSLYSVSSARGLPDNREFNLKFGTNSQNRIRYVNGQLLRVPDANLFCVVADNRPWYSVNWGTWASRGPNLPFDNCASTTATELDVCRDPVQVPPNHK